MLSLDKHRRFNSHYDILPLIINELGIQTMVEVGVHSGKLADTIMTLCPDVLDYYMIDPWKMPKCEMEYRRKIHKKAMAVASRHPRIHVIRATSRDAFMMFGESEAGEAGEAGMVDFAYVDANHSHEHVAEDIALWWTRVKPGGYLGGHDLDSKHGVGVRSAIEAAPVLAGLDIYHGIPPINWHGVWMVQRP